MTQTHTLEMLLSATHRLTRMAARSTGSSVSSAVWSTLSVLSTEGAYRIGDLARAARISQPGMTKLLQGLVEDEWVYRIADVEDSRAWLIAITPRGRAALDSWRTELARAMEPIFADLSPDDWAVLARAAQLVAGHVDADEVSA